MKILMRLMFFITDCSIIGFAMLNAGAFYDSIINNKIPAAISFVVMVVFMIKLYALTNSLKEFYYRRLV